MMWVQVRHPYLVQSSCRVLTEQTPSSMGHCSMCRVIDFKKYRERRRSNPHRPPKTEQSDTGSIQIHRRHDGSRVATMSGIYADDYPYVIEALADLAAKLAIALRLSTQRNS